MSNLQQIIRTISLGCSLFFITGVSYSVVGTTNTGYNLPANATQLAWWHGYRSGWSPRYSSGYYMYVPGPRYRNRSVYWTGWYRIAPHCQKRCLINGWGETIRCVRRCW